MKQQTIYLDYASTTPVDPAVARRVHEVLCTTYGNPSSTHSLGIAAKKCIDDARAIIAQRIDCHPDELIFTSGGTESNTLALRGIAQAIRSKSPSKNHIIISAIEHKSVLDCAKQLEREGWSVSIIPVTQEGFVKPETLQQTLTPTTALVSIIHGNNEIGTLQDIVALGSICKQNNVIFHTDAVQSFCKVPLAFAQLPVDAISISAHKIGGPKGTGGLVLRKGTPLEAQIRGGSQEFSRRAGTENVAGIAGFATAVQQFSVEDQKNIAEKMAYLENALKTTIPDIMFNGPSENSKRIPTICNIRIPGVEARMVLDMLSDRGICVSMGSACTSQSLQPSHVLTAIGLKPSACNQSLRLSIGTSTTKEDITLAVKTLASIILRLKESTTKKMKESIKTRE